ncbi:acyl carrier protein [Streptomyces kronopolitis]|uniref:Acyl carrier protein n=2 Tax=Streptomyces kronopolitis TaxID=1612435 RepID=A0ABQ2JZE6_9ACTN|nr:acyl carrier protein [Streptomyces kronopolitis]
MNSSQAQDPVRAGEPGGTDGADEAAVFGEIAGMLRAVLDEYAEHDVEITMDTTFHDDLDLESIDLVTLGGRLAARYGERVNFAEFLAGLELEEIIYLTVGRLVTFVVGCLRESRER